MKKIIFIIASLATVISLVSLQAEEPAKARQPASSDVHFIENAAKAGMAEVELSKEALKQSVNPDVQAFASMMVTDHTKANDELKAIATQLGVTIPTAIDAKHQHALEQLTKLRMAEFDKPYVKQMVEDHKAAVKEFEQASSSVKNAQLKSFVDQTLPTLKHHLAKAEELEAKLKKQ